jgi:hypothetical protein
MHPVGNQCLRSRKKSGKNLQQCQHKIHHDTDQSAAPARDIACVGNISSTFLDNYHIDNSVLFYKESLNFLAICTIILPHNN